MNPNESPNWKQRAEKAIAELKLVSDVLLATDYNVQGTAYPPNLVARAELLIVERAKLRAANVRAISERDAALAAAGEMRSHLEFFANKKHEGDCIFTDKSEEGCWKCRQAENGHWPKILATLSSPCGQGYVSPERLEQVVDATDNDWLNTIGEHYLKLFSKPWETKDGETTSEGRQANIAALFQIIEDLQPERVKGLVEALEKICSRPVHLEPVGVACAIQEIAQQALAAYKGQ